MNVNHYDTGKAFFDYRLGIAEFVEFLQKKYNYKEFEIAILLFAIISDKPTEKSLDHLREMGLFTTIDEFRDATRIFPNTFSKQIINNYIKVHPEFKIMTDGELTETEKIAIN